MNLRALVLPALLIAATASAAGPGRSDHPMISTVADRAGDAILSDGRGVYGGGNGGSSFLSDDVGEDRFMNAASSKDRIKRQQRLVLPSLGINTTCFWSRLYVREAVLWQMPVGTSQYAQGTFECRPTLSDKDAVNLEYGSCILVEHPSASQWIFTAGPGCTARVDNVVDYNVTVLGFVDAPYSVSSTPK